MPTGMRGCAPPSRTAIWASRRDERTRRRARHSRARRTGCPGERHHHTLDFQLVYVLRDGSSSSTKASAACGSSPARRSCSRPAFATSSSPQRRPRDAGDHAPGGVPHRGRVSETGRRGMGPPFRERTADSDHNAERSRWELSGIRAQALLLSIVPLSFLVLLLVLAGILQNKTEQTALGRRAPRMRSTRPTASWRPSPTRAATCRRTQEPSRHRSPATVEQ